MTDEPAVCEPTGVASWVIESTRPRIGLLERGILAPGHGVCPLARPVIPAGGLDRQIRCCNLDQPVAA
jgi:hypothetical protein